MAHRVGVRELKTRKAQARLELMIYDEAIKADLTQIELMQVLAAAQVGILKDMLRAERHPEDPDRPAALE